MIIEQYRPPVGKFVVGQSSQPYNTSLYPQLKTPHLYLPFPCFFLYLIWDFPLGILLTDAIEIVKPTPHTELPAGLIDDGETPEGAAIRELREETGYKAEGVLNSSSVVVNDPGPYIPILFLPLPPLLSPAAVL